MNATTPHNDLLEGVRHEISIVDDLMVVMDEDGNGYDAHVLTSYRDAKRQIQRWTAMYTINVADAYRQLHDFFSAQ